MHVLHVVSYVMERVGPRVARGGGTTALFSYLPQLWHHAAHHNMLRAAALSALVHLLKVSALTPPGDHDYLIFCSRRLHNQRRLPYLTTRGGRDYFITRGAANNLLPGGGAATSYSPEGVATTHQNEMVNLRLESDFECLVL